MVLLLTCLELFHAPTVQISAENSTILPPNILIMFLHSPGTNLGLPPFYFFPWASMYTGLHVYGKKENGSNSRFVPGL